MIQNFKPLRCAITLACASISFTNASQLELEVTAENTKGKFSYATTGVLISEGGVCLVGLPKDLTISKIEFKKEQAVSSASLIFYDAYGEFAFVKLSEEITKGLPITALAMSETQPKVNAFTLKTQSTEEKHQFTLAGKVGRHNGKSMPFYFHRVHSETFSGKPYVFEFLENKEGAVVSMIHSQVSEKRGAYFALPSYVIDKNLQDVKEFGMPTRAWIGVTLDANIGLPVVKAVRPTSSAAQAGIQKGDIITKIGKISVTDYDAAVKAFYLIRAKEQITFEVVRGMEIHSLELTPEVFPTPLK